MIWFFIIILLVILGLSIMAYRDSYQRDVEAYERAMKAVEDLKRSKRLDYTSAELDTTTSIRKFLIRKHEEKDLNSELEKVKEKIDKAVDEIKKNK